MSAFLDRLIDDEIARVENQRNMHPLSDEWRQAYAHERYNNPDTLADSVSVADHTAYVPGVTNE